MKPNNPANIRMLHILLILSVTGLVAGCGVFRLHDSGRDTAAQKTVELANEVAATELGFDAMRANVDVVGKVRGDVIAELRRIEQEAFWLDFTSLTAGDALDIIDESVSVHIEARNGLYESIEGTLANVNAALDRQKAIKKLLKGEKEPSSLEDLLKRVDKRLKWLEKNLSTWQKAFGTSDSEDEESASDIAVTDADGNADRKTINDKIDAYRKVIKGIEEDESVDAARKLLAQTAREITQIEQERLLEYRKHLRQLLALRTSFDRRDETYLNSFALPSVSAIDRVLADTIIEAIENSPITEESEQDLPHWSEPWQEAWGSPGDCGPWLGDSGLATYISQAANSKVPKPANNDCDPEKPNARLTVGLAELLVLMQFVELPLDEDLLIELGQLDHKHSLQVSSINARARLDLVRQTANALQIYYSGGITPEELAELVLLASQVMALGVIGANVD